MVMEPFNFDPYFNTTFREESPDESLAAPDRTETPIDLRSRTAPTDPARE